MTPNANHGNPRPEQLLSDRVLREMEAYGATLNDQLVAQEPPSAEEAVREGLGPSILGRIATANGALEAISNLWAMNPDLRRPVGDVVLQALGGCEDVSGSIKKFETEIRQRIRDGQAGGRRRATRDLDLLISRASHPARGEASYAISRIEQGKSVKMIPTFERISQETDRQIPITCIDVNDKGRTYEISEHEAIQELKDFLLSSASELWERTVPKMREGKPVDPEDALYLLQAFSMLTTSTFLGSKEIRESTRGIARYIKDVLEKNPEMKVCLLTGVGKLERYKDVPKSDEFVAHNILKALEIEAPEYRKRIVSTLDSLAASLDDIDVANTIIMLPEDWSLSGRQMRETIHEHMKDERFSALLRAGRVEIDLLVATTPQLKNGLELIEQTGGVSSVPIRSYYCARAAKKNTVTHKGIAHIGGIHSSANYNFDHILFNIALRLKKPAPSLARVSRYSRVVIDRELLPEKEEQ